MENLSLIFLTPEWQVALKEMAEDYRAAGESRHERVFRMTDEDFYAYLRSLEDEARDEATPANMVPQTTFWVVMDDNTLIGSVRVRHRLNETLEREGGHIAVDIRPSQRGKGYGGRALLLSLEKAAEIGLEKVLIVCDNENTASISLIEKYGGELIDEVYSPRCGKPVRRYWMKTAKAER